MCGLYINVSGQGATLPRVTLRISASINSRQIGGCSASPRGGGADIPSAEGENKRAGRRKTRRSLARGISIRSSLYCVIIALY